MKKFNRVCCVDSDYCFFIYILSSSKEEIGNTFFFFSDGIPESVRSYYSDQSFYFKTVGLNKLVVEAHQIIIRFFKFLLWPFLKHSDYYGMPFGGLSCEIIGNKPIHLIEEGYEHLQLSVVYKRKFDKIRRMLHGELYNNFTFEQSRICSIVLTRPLPFDIKPEIKVNYLNLEKTWKDNIYGRNSILNAHDVKQSDLVRLRDCKYLLITQTFAEDGLMSIEDEMSLYKKLINGIDERFLCIKPHPRERKGRIYRDIFKESFVFEKKVPVQLFNLEGISFESVYTICSTSINHFANNSTVIWGGTSCHPGLEKKFGKIKGCLDNV